MLLAIPENDNMHKAQGWINTTVTSVPSRTLKHGHLMLLNILDEGKGPIQIPRCHSGQESGDELKFQLSWMLAPRRRRGNVADFVDEFCRESK